MRPNTPHIVFTAEHSICLGGFYYGTSTLRDSCYGMMHSFASGGIATNSQHVKEAFQLLARMVRFYHEYMTHSNGALGGFDVADMDVDLRRSYFPLPTAWLLILLHSVGSLIIPSPHPDRI